ncbi:LLM class flavin-dependent oxidoreductase [Lysinibacillus agricola]|uniref:LLM class flavin-dependent oxidoreductase n=1 Tax=Lysinibacillus agricola TaxID=2590012 RepID=A0ABX7AX91_9BACI|nr:MULTISPECIES: LLM class flavin-dependent oxidoreductase [Lysinibacillus]KOS64286.1 hypothetical protein AN161_03665 [Lysinibacillus sp. FJAT-14222]QQP14406.1 LLM class flavin-dependent oxidoreductase [Lysinibacillus agricola]
MKYGVTFLPDCYPELKTPETWFKDALNIVELIDRVGFESVKITEHFFHPYGGYCGNPSNFLSAAAMRSKNLKLITGCVLPAFHNPLIVASELAMLDAISNGRMEAGFARAYLPYEFDAFKVSMDESRARYVEFIDAIEKLWTEFHTTFKGDFNEFKNITSFPPLTQDNNPQIWVATSASPQSFEWAGARGYNLMVTPTIADFSNFKDFLNIYRSAHEKAGHGKVEQDQIMLAYPMYVHENHETAHRNGKKYLKNYWQVWIDAANTWNDKNSSSYQSYSRMGEFLKTFSYERLVEEKRILVGTPQEVNESINYIKEEFDIGYLSFQVDFGGMPYECTKESIMLFNEKICSANVSDALLK